MKRRDLLKKAGLVMASVAAAPALADKSPDLTGKAVLITGTSSGFGHLAALHLARLGATVFATMRNMQGGSRPEAVALTKAAREERLALHLIEIDVTDARQVSEGVNRAIEIAGRALDAVVANAGIAHNGPVELADDVAVAEIFEINVMGALRTARAALPAMRARRSGLLIPISSQLGRIILPGVGSYCGTKFALEAQFEAMAYELAPFGVEVTIIQPGGYPTRIWDNSRKRTEAMLERATPEARAAYAEHLAIAAKMFGGGGSTDPMDVPRAIAGLLAMPAGTRPLRRPVHPNTAASDAANAALAGIQAQVMGAGPFAPWLRAVQNSG